jgi:hypothetical protein
VPDERVEVLEQLGPAPIADGRGELGRLDEVGEDDGRRFRADGRGCLRQVITSSPILRGAGRGRIRVGAEPLARNYRASEAIDA